MNEKLLQIKQLFDRGLGSRLIAKQLNMTRWAVQQVYKELGIYNIGRKKPYKEIPAEKICKECNGLKAISEFRSRLRNGHPNYEPYCKICETELNKKWCKKRYEEHPEKWQEYREKNLEQIHQYDKEYREKNKDIIAEKRKNNPEHKEYLRNYNIKKRKENPEFKIRGLLSNAIRYDIKTNGAKKDRSILKGLSYSMKELKNHLETQFETWMTWENHGRYIKKTWDDNDSSTWTWQIDHIIPCSDLSYTSMDDENFKKCWALENLRPYSAKQNVVDGTTRSRHMKKNS